jgi:uncharacterized DUF497 family protein
MAHATIKKEDGRLLQEVSGFEWDAGNRKKSIRKHEVSNEECEEAFFDHNKDIQKDNLHSINEERYVLLGQTRQNRLLYIIFTIRKDKIRVISARDINKKERNLYEEKN